ncbi:MAG: phage SPO1 DNA polymerase-related protein [Parcubacteria group bacterium Licking1014_17]|nr:MAG: phage SPO1 DNA polymerase-related protein [Parcubacteria group bacterium Licking1014_17]
MDKKQKLEYIWGAIKRAYPKRKLVFNDGSPDSQIMIIGEAPGVDEEIQGKPFVGRAGKLLNATLETLGWQRSDFYVSNIVKYRPTDEFGRNRTPTPEEIEKFRAAIEKEIEAVDPKIVVLLGKVAMSGLGVEGAMGENRGKVFDKFNRKVLITYHPAAILRNINWEANFRSDLSKIRELLDA